jgi:hypothetical protein
MSEAAESFIRFGLETGVAYTSGEFRGKDGQLRVSVEVGAPIANMGDTFDISALEPVSET